jgi:hypothetical protein
MMAKESRLRLIKKIKGLPGFGVTQIDTIHECRSSGDATLTAVRESDDCESFAAIGRDREGERARRLEYQR